MTTQAWLEFFTHYQQQAQSDASLPSGQSTPVAWPNNHALYPLASDGLIAVSGADALDFLQGQLTNDIKQVRQHAQLTGYCTAKGRLLALFYAFSWQDTVYLQCPRTLVPALVKRLRMFVLRSKVTIEDVSDQFLSLGLSSTQAEVIEHWPQTPDSVTPLAGGVLIRLASVGEIHRARLICPVASAETHWPTISQPYQIAAPRIWEWLDIQAGTPQVYPATQEQFVPQMLNLDVLNGINFKKGCYTGQEIVARTHYLGKVKRRTGIATLALAQGTPARPQTGEVVLDAQQQEAGQIVRVAMSPDQQQCWLLVEYRLEAKQTGAITWQSHALTWQPSPYALED